MEKASPIGAYRWLRRGRIASQALFFLLFIFLFVKTDYTGSDTIEYAVNILFRIDPLLALATMLAVKTVISLMLPALLVIALSLLAGRSFCGWLCPLGGLLDGWSRLFGSAKPQSATKFSSLPKMVLIVVLVSALFGVPLAGYVDPFSILVRGLSQAVYPGINDVSVTFFTFTYQHLPATVNLITEPLYSFLQQTILPFEQKFYQLGLVSLFVLFIVVIAEHGQKRFFCRNICPLGALLGWFSRMGVLSLAGGNEDCRACRRCAQICRMGAIDEHRTIDVETCVLCMDCFEKCPRQIISFGAEVPISRGVGGGLTRRQFLAATSASLVLPSVLGVRTLNVQADPLLIRPPGSLAEPEFLNRCVRCGQCMQVCITNGLQPVMLRAGIEGMFSPYLVARTGYCEFNCTLCGQVCPTGALQVLDLDAKHRFKIGHAWFDKDRCLPYAKGIECIVCEEHCPTPEKAIKFRNVDIVTEGGNKQQVQQPYVDDALCIGCGICETKCPLPDISAIFVTSAGEHRHPDSRLPTAQEPLGYGS
ncbi:MAG: 4Fe-4S binding protein [Desulfofustis sp.]|nr:4Fe-4S binding protein [Desulfofustis sp.]